MFNPIHWYKEWKAKAPERAGNAISQKVSNKDTRQEAFDYLYSLPPEKSIPQLIRRFDLNSDSNIQDNEEKTKVLLYLKEYSQIALPHIKFCIEKKPRVSWYFKAAQELMNQEDFLQTLLSVVNPEISLFNEFGMERNKEALLWLKDIPHPSIGEKIIPFFSIPDEEIRVAAFECLAAQAEKDTQARSLLKNLLKIPPSDDNNRLLGLVKSHVQKMNW